MERVRLAGFGGASTTGGFGGASTTGGFGTSTTPAGGGFGATGAARTGATAGGFGSGNTASGGFGAASTLGGFGATSSSTTGGGFGAMTSSGVGGFGAELGASQNSGTLGTSAFWINPRWVCKYNKWFWWGFIRWTSQSATFKLTTPRPCGREGYEGELSRIAEIRKQYAPIQISSDESPHGLLDVNNDINSSKRLQGPFPWNEDCAFKFTIYPPKDPAGQYLQFADEYLDPLAIDRNPDPAKLVPRTLMGFSRN